MAQTCQRQNQDDETTSDADSAASAAVSRRRSKFRTTRPRTRASTKGRSEQWTPQARRPMRTAGIRCCSILRRTVRQEQHPDVRQYGQGGCNHYFRKVSTRRPPKIKIEGAFLFAASGEPKHAPEGVPQRPMMRDDLQQYRDQGWRDYLPEPLYVARRFAALSESGSSMSTDLALRS